MGDKIRGVIDDRVIHILMKVENSSAQDVVEELALDSEVEDLLEMRDGLFTLAKDKLEYILRDEGKLGEEEDSGVTKANRTNRSKAANVAKEVVELYKYVALETVNSFPRSLLSKETKFLDILPSEVKIDEEEGVEHDNKLIDKIRIIELTNILKDQQRMIEKILKINDEQQHAIDNLDQKVSGLMNQLNRMKSPSPKSPNSGHIGDSDNLRAFYEKYYPPELVKSLRSNSKSPASSQQASLTKKSSPARVSHIRDSSGSDMTVLHKAKKLETSTIDDLMKGKHPIAVDEYTTAAWPMLPHKENINIGYHPNNPENRSSKQREMHEPSRESTDRNTLNAADWKGAPGHRSTRCLHYMAEGTNHCTGNIIWFPVLLPVLLYVVTLHCSTAHTLKLC